MTKYVMYICTGCNLKGFHKGNMERHARNKCVVSGADVATYSVEITDDQLTRVTENQAILSPLKQFFQQFAGVSDNQSRQARAAYFYDKEEGAETYLNVLLDIKGINSSDSLASFARYITLMYGYRCVKPEWRSVWLSDKHIYINMGHGDVTKYPKDTRHKIMVLGHLYNAYKWTLDPATMDTFHDREFNRVTDCATIINNTLQEWSERIPFERHVQERSLEDLVTRKYNRSKLQKTLLDHFEGMFWHFTEVHVDDPHLKMLSEEVAKDKISRVNVFGVDENSYSESVRNIGRPYVPPISEEVRERQQAEERGYDPEIFVKAYYCDCGKTSNHKSNMVRHINNCIYPTFTEGRFKLCREIPRAEATAQTTLSPELDVRIKVQSIMARLPTVDEFTVSDDISCTHWHQSIVEEVERYGATEGSFMKFYKTYFEKDIPKNEWIRFWTVQHSTAGTMLVYVSNTLSSITVRPFDDGWHEIFTLMWNQFIFLYNPGRPSRAADFSIHDACQEFVRHKRTSPMVETLKRRIYTTIPRMPV